MNSLLIWVVALEALPPNFPPFSIILINPHKIILLILKWRKSMKIIIIIKQIAILLLRPKMVLQG